MNKIQTRVTVVLNRLIDMANEDLDVAIMIGQELDIMLDRIKNDDGFGTEGQCDPRGDFRECDSWSMDFVEGVDTLA